MQKKFVTNLAFLLFLNLLVKPFYILGIDAEVQNQVGTAVYGNYFAILNFSFLLNILLDMGITNYNTRNIAQHSQMLNKHLSSILSLKFILGTLYISVTLLTGLLVGYGSDQMKLLLILGFNQALVSLILYLRSNLAGLLLFKQDSVISILDRSLLILFCSVLLWGNVTDQAFQIEWFVYAQTAAYAVTALAAFVLVLRKSKSFRLKFKIPFSMMILKQSFPFALLFLLMTFYSRIDSVMLERMLPDGKEQAGIYAQGFRLLDAANMIAYLFAALLLPIFSRMIKEKESVADLVVLSFKILFSGAFVVAVGCFIYSDQMMAMRYSESFIASGPVFGILMCCFVAISTTYIFGTLLTANGSLKALNLMAVAGIIINIVLNLVLIPKYAAYGSAVATLFTQFLTAIIQVIIAQYIFKFRVNYKLLLTITVFVAGVFLIGKFTENLHETWWINLCIMLAASAIWAFVTQLLSVKAMYRILKYDR
jgi:O-antigen/teichoic acid export membrane protein